MQLHGNTRNKTRDLKFMVSFGNVDWTSVAEKCFCVSRVDI